MRQTFNDFFLFIRTQGVIGLAVAFVLGKAISDVIGSIVNDLVNPVIGIVLGKLGDLSALSLQILDANITYGKFISVVINFTIVAAVIYFGVKKLGLEKLDAPKQ